MSETWYDEKEDILGIQLKNRDYWKSVEVSKNVVVDLSESGEIMSIEILGAKRSFKKDSLRFAAGRSIKEIRAKEAEMLKRIEG